MSVSRCEDRDKLVVQAAEYLELSDLSLYLRNIINKEQFLRHFNDILEENQSAKC